jgi:hypothetical protein
MDLIEGIAIDEPYVFVPWDATGEDLERLLWPHARQVGPSHWTARVVVFGGLACDLGFHYRGRGGELSEVEFFRHPYLDQSPTFEEFARFFEATLGKPIVKRPVTDEGPSSRALALRER